MTDQDIVSHWLLVPANRNKLQTVAYPEVIYRFIVNTMDCHSFGADDIPVYKVGNSWQKVISK